MKRLSGVLFGAGCVLSIGAPQAVQAQEDGIIVEPSIAIDYDRGRNVSVIQRPRPDYDALGIRTGGFTVFPRLDVGLGYNNNIFLAEDDGVSDAYAIVQPSVRVQSGWSRHQLNATASGAFRRYFDHPGRNENSWNVGSLGRLDVTSAANITAEVQFGNRFETPFSGGVDSETAALSNYDYSLLSLRGEYRMDRNRFTLAYNRNSYDFNKIVFPDSSVIDQSNRNRTIDGIVGQSERALSPSASIYIQLSYARTRYDNLLLPGVANRDSHGYRVVGGISLDLPAFLRGTFAAGYTWRNFDSPLFKNVGGLSVDAKLEYFYSEFTTFTLRGRRLIQDSSIGIDTAYFDNRASLSVDHELLENLILSASGDLSYQTYVRSPQKITVYRLGTRARYLMSRQLSADLAASYSARHRDPKLVDGSLGEFRVEATLSFRL